jgi:hypothetical protein
VRSGLIPLLIFAFDTRIFLCGFFFISVILTFN